MTQVDNGNNTTPADEISLKEIIYKLLEYKDYLKSKWKTILIISLIGAILGVTYSLLKKPVYKAELSFALEEDNGSSGGLGSALGLASQFGVDLGGSAGGAFSGDNLMELMKSRSMVEKTLLTTIEINGQKQTLAELYISFNKYRDDWENSPALMNVKFLPGADRSKFTLKQDSVLGGFYKVIDKKILSVDKKDKKLTIIVIKVESKNELFSKCFTEVLAKTVSDFYIDSKTKKEALNVNVLQRQTDSVRRELNAAINGVASSSDVNPNANPALQVLRVQSQRRQVDVQANTVILAELVKNLEISKISLRKETPLIQIIDRPILPLEKEAFGIFFGIEIGGFLFGFLAVVVLLINRIFNKLMS